MRPPSEECPLTTLLTTVWGCEYLNIYYNVLYISSTYTCPYTICNVYMYVYLPI